MSEGPEICIKKEIKEEYIIPDEIQFHNFDSEINVIVSDNNSSVNIPNHGQQIDMQRTEEMIADTINSRQTIKRRRFTFKEKIKILRRLDTESSKSVCQEFRLNDRVIRKWKKQKKEIEENSQNENYQNFSRKGRVMSPRLDDTLYNWYLSVRAKGLSISGPVLKTTAITLNAMLNGNPKFVASDGWLDKWKRRKGIRSLRN